MKFLRFPLAGGIATAAMIFGVYGHVAFGDLLSVTGKIPRTKTEASQAVTVIDSEDIESFGVRSFDELWQRLVFSAVAVKTEFFINGRPTVVNSDSIPVSAIERIEILNGGGSAYYGAEATGGAVNIILKSNFEGSEYQTYINRPSLKGNDIDNFSLIWGSNEDGNSIMLGFDYFSNEEIRDKDRFFSKSVWKEGGSFADTQAVSVLGNTVIASDFSDATSIGNCATDIYTGVLIEPFNISGGEGCGFPYAEYSWLSSNLKRSAAFFGFSTPGSDSSEIYADLRASKIDSRIVAAPATDLFEVEASSIPGVESSFGNPVTVGHRFIANGNRTDDTQYSELDLALGIRGQLDNLVAYDIEINRFTNTGDVTGHNYIRKSTAIEKIADQTYVIYDPQLTDPNVLQEISYQTARNITLRRSEVRAVFNGNGFILNGFESKWAGGVELMRETYIDDYDEARDEGDVIGSSLNSTAGNRKRRSGFGELNIPLTESWNFDVAGRYDRYDDVGELTSGKIGILFRASDSVALRTSASKGESRPNYYNLYGRSISHPFVKDTSSCRPNPDARSRQVESEYIGNPNLEPESVARYGIGVSASFDRFVIDGDYFEIDIEDGLANSAQTVIELEGCNRLQAGAEVQRNGDTITGLTVPTLNLVTKKYRGAQLRARYNWELASTKFDLDWHWTHLAERKSTIADSVIPDNFPKDRMNLTLRGIFDSFSTTWKIRTVSGFSNNARTARYDKFIGHDVSVQWNNAFNINNLQLTAGVLNATDVEPPTDPTNSLNLGVRTYLHPYSGRRIFLATRLSF